MGRSAQFLIVVVCTVCCASAARSQDNTGQEIDVPHVRALIHQLGSDSFQQRQNAESALLKMGKPLLDVLADLDAPNSIEIKYRLKRIKHDLTTGRFVGYFWTLKCWPLDGETLNLKSRKTLRFFEYGKFQQVDSNTKTRHTWRLTENGMRIELNYNKGYAIYQGQFVDSTHAKGFAENVKGRKWHFELKRTRTKVK